MYFNIHEQHPQVRKNLSGLAFKNNWFETSQQSRARHVEPEQRTIIGRASPYPRVFRGRSTEMLSPSNARPGLLRADRRIISIAIDRCSVFCPRSIRLGKSRSNRLKVFENAKKRFAGRNQKYVIYVIRPARVEFPRA